MRGGASKKLNIWKLLGCVVLLLLALVAALGFSFYRSMIGPSPSFRINHAKGLKIQSVYVNGFRAPTLRKGDHLFVNRNVPPMAPVSLSVITTDGRQFDANFAEMGHVTRIIDVNGFQTGNYGRLLFLSLIHI